MSSKSPPIFALIIGIDEYRDSNIVDLRFAKNDANEVENFLISRFRIPRDRIANLRDEKATREAIISAMENLANNPVISKHDPILIYYAGHGGEAPAPYGWSTSSANGKVQMLLPYDFISNGSNNAPGQGILDMTISLLLSEIASKKSDNITVIFDCCHSGSGTRNASTVRGVDLPNYTIPAHLFSKERELDLRHQKGGLKSHVLLAACEPHQKASENGGHGYFTKELLRLLKEEDTTRLSYKDVIMRMRQLDSQTPRCEGVNSNRILFTFDVEPRPVVFNLRPDPEGSNQFILEAGEAHGITNGAEFDVYYDENLNPPIGRVVVSERDKYTSQCSSSKVPCMISRDAYAVQRSRPEKLRLFIDRKNQCYAQLTQLIQDLCADRMYSVHLVGAGDMDLGISASNGNFRFEIGNKMCREHGLTHMPFDVEVGDDDKVLNILRGAANFYHRLDLRGSNNSNSLDRKVDVECFRLCHNDLGLLVPESDANLNIGGTITIDVGDNEDEAEPYGYRIRNKLKFPLHVDLIYFDISNLKIESYFLNPTAQEKAESLPAKGFLTIGFGDGGWKPPVYYVRENQTIDIGFLKLYVSTRHIDYSFICQPSPFGCGDDRASGFYKKNKTEIWGTMIIPIVQKKR